MRIVIDVPANKQTLTLALLRSFPFVQLLTEFAGESSLSLPELAQAVEDLNQMVVEKIQGHNMDLMAAELAAQKPSSHSQQDSNNH